MVKIDPVVLALSSIALNPASSAPAWYPRECAAIDYFASVEHVFWVSPTEDRPPPASRVYCAL